MILYMSGGEIEEPLKKEGIENLNLMMSFFTSHKKPEKRFLRIYKSRKRKLKGKQK